MKHTVTQEKTCLTCAHYLSAENLGKVCMNTLTDSFGRRKLSTDSCWRHSERKKRATKNKS